MVKWLAQRGQNLSAQAYDGSTPLHVATRQGQADVARWLLTASKLSKNRIGDYLGRSDEDATRTLGAFLAPLDFAAFSFDEALRFFLSLFRLPGESQQIDRIMETFARRYHETRPGVFSSSDTAHILAFSLLMLNTDRHNPEVVNKMTLEQFVSNNRGVGPDGTDLPRALLESLYSSIKSEEIQIEQREYIWAATAQGW